MGCYPLPVVVLGSDLTKTPEDVAQPLSSRSFPSRWDAVKMCNGESYIPSRRLPFGAQMETEGIRKSLMKEADLGPDFKRQTGRLHIKGCSFCSSPIGYLSERLCTNTAAPCGNSPCRNSHAVSNHPAPLYPNIQEAVCSKC